MLFKLSLNYLKLFIIFLFLIIPTKVLSQSVNLESAESAYISGNYSQALTIWKKLTEQELEPEELAQVYSNIGSVYWEVGEPGKAVPAWEKSVSLYRKHLKKNSNIANLFVANLIDLATAYNDLGQPIFSKSLLFEAIEVADKYLLNHLLPFIYFTKGNSYVAEGNYSEAIGSYSMVLQYIQQFPHQSYEKDNLEFLTHDNLSRAYAQQAILTKQQALASEEFDQDLTEILGKKVEDYKILALKSALTALRLVENQPSSLFKAEALLQLEKLSTQNPNSHSLQQAQDILLTLPASWNKVYRLLNLAELMPQDSLPILMAAVESAEQINNPRVASFAYGAVGNYYEKLQQYSEAAFWTQKAQQAASSAQAHDSLYKWHWQMGRILTQTQNPGDATSFYQSAIASLQIIRPNLFDSSKFDFEEDIEPIYRELLQLLLSQDTGEENIIEILQIRDLLQLSELENFFQDDCLSLNNNLDIPETLKATNSVIITSIILENQTYLVWQFPSGKSQITSLKITKTELEKLVKQWRFNLENLANDNYLPISQKLYRLFFNSDSETELATINPSNLVFINDGILRNVPMSALHDGTQFLIEKYPVSVSLGLSLQLKEPDIDKEILAFGIASKIEKFPPLPHVKQEFQEIELVASKNKQFLDQDFTIDNFLDQTSYTNFPIIHLATHAWFSGDLENSFLQAFERKISLPEFELALTEHNINFPNNRFDLLVLSACATAIGNDRATLGLSGVALRSGVNNVLGSLWAVNDREIVPLLSEFYRQWIDNNSSKAESLRQAQLNFINRFDNHPAIWSPMILMIN